MKNQILKFTKDPMLFFAELVIPSNNGPMPFGQCIVSEQREWLETISPSLLAINNGQPPPIGKFMLIASKGYGKDQLAGMGIVFMLAFTRRPLHMISGAHDRDQAGELKRSIQDLLRLNRWLQKRVEVQVNRIVCSATNSELQILSSDAVGSHGQRPDVSLINELSHIHIEDFANTLADNHTKKAKTGLMIVCSNAGHTNSWQHRWYLNAKESDQWHLTEWCQPAPWLDESTLLEAQRRNSRARYDRLFLGRWVPLSGDALDESDVKACVDRNLRPLTSRQPGEQYIAALDLGISHDHSALVIVGYRHDSQQLTLADCHSWAPDSHTGKVDLIEIETTILALHRRFDFQTLAYDPYQSQLLCQRLERQGIRTKEVTFIGKNLDEMASCLLDVLRSHRIRLYDDPELLDDLSRLSIQERSYGHRLVAERTKDGHCDRAIALSIALPLCVEESARVPVVAGALFRTQQPSYNGMPKWLQNFERRKRDLEKHETWLREQNKNQHMEGFLPALRQKLRNH